MNTTFEWPTLHQWHPAAIHYPIVFLTLEAFFLILFAFRKKTEFETFANWLLVLALISFVPAVVTGIYDAGADLGPGSQFINGLRDRISNFFRYESTISIHVLLACTLIVLTILRSIIRLKSKPFSGMIAAVFGILTAVGLVLVFLASYIGGSVSHS